MPALPIRYTLGFGSALVGLTALALCAVAAGAALQVTARSWDLTPAAGTLSVAAWLDRVVPVCAVTGAPAADDRGGR